jgi:hypothetical protein
MTKKNSTNGIEPIGAPRIWKLVLSVRKLEGSDMDKSNPYAICNAIHLFIVITMWKTMLCNVEDNGNFELDIVYVEGSYCWVALLYINTTQMIGCMRSCMQYDWT